MKSKKIICVVLALAIAAAVAAVNAGAASYSLGDVNMDGFVRADDARLALRASADLAPLLATQFSLADVNSDGRVKADDAREILRAAAKLSTLKDVTVTTPGHSETAKPAAPATTKPAAPTTTKPAAPTTTKPVPSTTAAPKVPSSAAEIADFYKTAVNKVKNGAAGYTKKDWQSVGAVDLGSSAVNSLAQSLLGKFMTKEADAKEQVCAKGSDEAKNRFPSFTLSDYSYIASASCTKNANGNYVVRIVFKDEDTPREGSSMMSKVTNSFLSWDDVEESLADISAVKSVENTHLYYRGFTIDCEITPAGNFVWMNHTAPVDVAIGRAKVSMFTVENRSAHLDMYGKYTNFVY